jgi:hypothetical protein
MNAQVIKYKCCGKVYAACMEPRCYTNKDWLKDIKKAVKDGDKIEMLDTSSFQMDKCTCNKEPITNQLDLFK